jgi:hypothetical protein
MTNDQQQQPENRLLPASLPFERTRKESASSQMSDHDLLLLKIQE